MTSALSIASIGIQNQEPGSQTMSIEKKSLISALKTTKKANIASTPEGEKAVSSKAVGGRAVSSKAVSAKAVSAKAVSAKAVSAKAVSAKAVSAKSVSAKSVR
jgi:hypothetical protein